ncbi:MAG: hypothetical protein ACTSUD_06640 [Alphaproteobacteria bacterium]
MSTETYAGDISAREAWELLERDGTAVLVDCRTRPEWAFVGVPDLSTIEAGVVFTEWQIFPSMLVNDDFAAQLSAGANLDSSRRDAEEDRPFFVHLPHRGPIESRGGGHDASRIWELLQCERRIRGALGRQQTPRRQRRLEGRLPALDPGVSNE